MPVTVRIPSFGGIGAVEHHSESTETYWAHTAGLKVVVPSTPSDAYWLLRHAIASRDPVIYLEPKRRYWSREDVDTSQPGLPIGRAAVRRIGDDVTVLTYGGLVADRAGCSGFGGRPARLEPGGGRPALAEPARLRHGGGVGAQDRASGGDARGRRARSASAPSWRPASRRSCSTTWRHRCCAPPDLTRRIRRRGWRSCGCPASTGCWTASSERWSNHERPSERQRRSLVPDLGEGLEDATITGWSVAVGDDVELNQTLCTVETNKAEVEIPSPYAGRIVELGGAEGETLAVGTVLVRIATDAPAPAAHNGDRPARKPVLVGYGADDEMDTSRRAPVETGRGRARSRRSASWPRICRWT